MSLDLFGDVSTQDTGARSDLDFYETPSWMTRSLLYWHPAIRGASVLEPCSGRDAIATVLRAYGCRVFTNDLDPRHTRAQTHFDATQPDYWLDHAPRVDYVVTNVPFALAFPILQHAIHHARIGVAFLLRVTFTEPTEDRGAWLNTYPPTREIGLPRYAFRGKGSDSCATDWFLWERQPDRRLRPFVIDDLAETRTRNGGLTWDAKGKRRRSMRRAPARRSRVASRSPWWTY